MLQQTDGRKVLPIGLTDRGRGSHPLPNYPIGVPRV